MKIGAYYYPEQWPRNQWKRDFDRFAEMGLQIIHLAEFAWHWMEPREGEFQFDWLDQCLEMSAQRKLDVILCTPTAAPPVWLVQRYPDVLMVDRHATPARPGGRRHYSPSSPAMRDATRRIVAELAGRYGDHPSVIGWQIDNELSGAFNGDFDQSPETHTMFRQWLRDKYGTLDELHRAWGSQFWNQYYSDFDEILFPAGRDAVYGNPHQYLDGSRFWSWLWADFCRLQAEILRPKIGQRFITTNFMRFHLDCDPADMARDLTLMSWDAYPMTGWEKNVSDEQFRLADPNAIGMAHAQMASYTGRWAQMELQPGQINWSGVPVLHYPGAVRLWIWTAFAHGAEFVTTYRFRQPLWGFELFHQGLMRTDGITPSRGGEEFMQVINEIKRLNLTHDPSPSTPSVGLLFDFEQLWYLETMPQTRRWNQLNWIQTWYAALMRLGVNVRMVLPGQTWPHDMRMLVAPAVQMVDNALVKQMSDYASAGGHLILTCRSGLMNRHGQLWEGPMAAPILPLIGAELSEYDVMPDESFAHVEMDGNRYGWGAWGDWIKPADGTQVLARYADQFYAGTAAVTTRRNGRGNVTYCGVCGGQDFVDALVEKLARQSNLPITPLPPRVHLLQRDGYHVLLNYSLETVEAPASNGAQFIIGQRRVAPADVAVWKIQ